VSFSLVYNKFQALEIFFLAEVIFRDCFSACSWFWPKNDKTLCILTEKDLQQDTTWLMILLRVWGSEIAYLTNYHRIFGNVKVTSLLKY